MPLLRRQLPVLLLSLAGALGSQAQTKLTTDSPFLPVGGPVAAATENAVLEFRGAAEIGGELYFCLVDTAAPGKKGVWVKPNESGRDFTVKSYDPKSDMVSVDYRGRLLQLPLAKPKVAAGGFAPMPVPQPPQAGNPANPANSGPIAPVVLNPTPADEAQRLEAFAAEVRRRRQMREQGGQPTPAAPQPQPQPQAQPAMPPVPQRRPAGQ